MRAQTPPPPPPPRVAVNRKAQEQKPTWTENETVNTGGVLRRTGIKLLLFVAIISCAVGIFTIGVLIGGNLN